LDGYGFGNLIESCNPMPGTGYSLNNLDCDDGDEGVYPGSNICFSGGCYVCSFEGERIPNDSCNPSNSGNCKKCVDGILENDDRDSIILQETCKVCQDGALINLNGEIEGRPCKTCIEGELFNVEDGIFGENVCQECLNGEVILLTKEIEGEICKECIDGEILLLTQEIEGDSCKICQEGELVNLNGAIEGESCKKCFEGEKVNDDFLNLPDNGDCLKCVEGDLVLDNNDEIVFGNPCQECLNGEVILLTKEIEGEICKECVNGLEVNVLDGPIEENPCRACIGGELSLLTGTSINLGECQKCEEGDIKNSEEGGVCGSGNPLSMCCGGACSVFPSASVKELSTCCGGEVYVEDSRRDFRRNSCCDEEYVSLRSPENCGACGRECGGSTPNCFMSGGFFEDCYKCVECLSNADCPGAQVCVPGSKNCLRIFPPSLRGVFREVIYAATPADAIDLLIGRLGYSNRLVCSGQGYETISVEIISTAVGGFVPGAGFAFTITYRLVVNTYDSEGNLL
jgi:hypothetical protein